LVCNCFWCDFSPSRYLALRGKRNRECRGIVSITTTRAIKTCRNASLFSCFRGDFAGLWSKRNHFCKRCKRDDHNFDHNSKKYIHLSHYPSLRLNRGVSKKSPKAAIFTRLSDFLFFSGGSKSFVWQRYSTAVTTNILLYPFGEYWQGAHGMDCFIAPEDKPARLPGLPHTGRANNLCPFVESSSLHPPACPLPNKAGNCCFRAFRY